jgi:hypothetical protein
MFFVVAKIQFTHVPGLAMATGKPLSIAARQSFSAIH